MFSSYCLRYKGLGVLMTLIMADERVDFRLENDSSMIISGPSKSGKTMFVLEMLKRKDRLFRHPIRNVYWFHGAAQDRVHDKLCTELGVIMKHGVPTEEDFEPIQRHDLVVIDDLQDEIKQDSHITSLFLKQTHHRHFFAILIQQNIYGDKEQRYRNANVHYWVGFNNPRNQRQLGEFLSRMYPSGKATIYRIFSHIMEQEGNYGYLFVDFTAERRSDLRLRSHIFTSPMHVYKVLERGGFSEWMALSTLDETAGSTMDYSNMVLVPKARYQTMVGGATRSQVLALLNPQKAYAKETAKELVDYKISPENVSDYYNKLIQFDAIRRDFFLPKSANKATSPLPQKQQPPLPSPMPLTSPPLPFATPPNTMAPKPVARTKSVKRSLAERQKHAEDRHAQRMIRPRLSLRDRNAANNFQHYGRFAS